MILDLLKSEEKKLIKIKKYKKNEIIFRENDECQNIGIVIFGIINISSNSFNGNQVVFNTIKSGEIFGGNLLFSTSNNYKGNVIAKTNSEIAFISKRNLLNIMSNNTSFLEHYLTMHSDFGIKLNTKVKILSFSNAEDRLFYYLYANNGSIKVISTTALANELSLSREATSRLLSRLIKEKKIIRNNNVITQV